MSIHHRRGGTAVTLLTVGATAALLGAGALFVSSQGRGSDGAEAEDRFRVERGTFDISIPASGELEALTQVEIRNRFEYRAAITFIIDEGATVKKGDELFRLGDEDIRNRIKDAEDVLNNAEMAFVTADSNLNIKRKTAESEIAKADLNVRLADLALRAWTEGDDVSRRQALRLDQETASINYERLVNRYEDSKRLVAQEFISQDEFKRDEIAKIEAKARLDQANLALLIYDEYLREQARQQKTSDLEQAKAELVRVRERFKVELETAEAEVLSRTHNRDSRRIRLDDLNEQFGYCTVIAPEDGWVVYASSLQSGRNFRNNGQPPTVGTELSRNDLVIVLPDTSQMIATVKVNESLSGLIEPGLIAQITSDAMPDTVLEGEVLSIGVLAESGGWIDRNRRDYTVKLKISNGDGLGLKPSMRCKADIFVGQAVDTLYVPVQAIFRDGPSAYVYVPDGGGFSQGAVVLGKSSELFVEVTEGLDVGDMVLLREPKPQEIVTRLAGNGAKGRGFSQTVDQTPPRRRAAEQARRGGHAARDRGTARN